MNSSVIAVGAYAGMDLTEAGEARLLVEVQMIITERVARIISTCIKGSIAIRTLKRRFAGANKYHKANLWRQLNALKLEKVSDTPYHGTHSDCTPPGTGGPVVNSQRTSRPRSS